MRHGAARAHPDAQHYLTLWDTVDTTITVSYAPAPVARKRRARTAAAAPPVAAAVASQVPEASAPPAPQICVEASQVSDAPVDAPPSAGDGEYGILPQGPNAFFVVRWAPTPDAPHAYRYLRDPARDDNAPAVFKTEKKAGEFLASLQKRDAPARRSERVDGAQRNSRRRMRKAS